MKLVELLAKVVGEWPKGAEYAVQDGDHLQTIKYGKTKGNLGLKEEGHGLDVWQNRSWGFTSNHDFDHDELASDFLTAIVIKAQWQAERDRQKGGEWKRHRGGKQPVADEVRVEFKFRSGVTGECYADNLLWDHQKQYDDVMQYRIISQPQAEEVEMKLNERVQAEFDKPDSEKGIIQHESSAAFFEHLGIAKTDQIDGPFKWRDEVAELNAYIEKYTRERDALIERLASEGFALIPAMTPVIGVADIDMRDWRNWKVGDVFITDGECQYYTKGKEYSVHGLENDSAPIKAIDDNGDVYCLFMEEVKFVRRP